MLSYKAYDNFNKNYNDNDNDILLYCIVFVGVYTKQILSKCLAACHCASLYTNLYRVQLDPIVKIK